MSKRKFKSIGILFLSIIYLSVLCLSSLSFAIIVPNNENLPEGKYYIKNKGSNYFMGGVA